MWQECLTIPHSSSVVVSVNRTEQDPVTERKEEAKDTQVTRVVYVRVRFFLKNSWHSSVRLTGVICSLQTRKQEIENIKLTSADWQVT